MIFHQISIILVSLQNCEDAEYTNFCFNNWHGFHPNFKHQWQCLQTWSREVSSDSYHRDVKYQMALNTRFSVLKKTPISQIDKVYSLWVQSIRVLVGYFLYWTLIFNWCMTLSPLISITLLCTWLCAIRSTHANLSTFHVISNHCSIVTKH